MELGIKGRWALVCAASKGLGKGCALALAREGANVVVTARGAEALEATVAELRALNAGGEVRGVAGDITTEAGRAAALAACPQVDILVNNAGGPPPGDFRSWEREAWIAALDANMLAPIDILGLSNGARSGLTGFVAGLARSQLAARGVTINNLLPGAFDTDRLRVTLAGQASKTGRSIDEIGAQRAATIPLRRFGRPEEFGAACAFLCSAHAAYLTGQNILIDGGAYPGTF